MLGRESQNRSVVAKAEGGSVRRFKRVPRILLPLVILAGSLGSVFVATLPASAVGTSTVTMPNKYGAVGDLAVLAGHYNADGTVISSIVGTQSGTWTRQVHHDDSGIADGGAFTGKTSDIWTAPVTGTASDDVLTITYSASLAGATVEYWPFSLTAGLGSSTVWSYTPSGGGFYDDNTGASLVVTYPTLTSGAAVPQTYIGVVGDVNTAVGGSTSGFHYVDSTISQNEMVYDLSLATNTAYTPTATSSSASSYSAAAAF